MVTFYVAQYYHEQDEEWVDSVSESDPNHPRLDDEAKWDARCRTTTGNWRVIQRTEKVLRSGVEE